MTFPNSFKCLLLSLSAYYYQFSCNVQESRASGATGYRKETRISVIKERLLRMTRSDGRIGRVGLLTIFCVLFSFAFAVEAQAQELRQGGATGYEEVFPLMVGQKVPEEFWTHESLFFVGSDTLRLDLKQEKGKHVILAFWSLDCGACLLNLPNIQNLKKEFDEWVAIIPVNNQTRRNEYQRFYDFFNKGHRLLPEKFSVPSIVYDSFYDELFPYRVLPRYIWIGRNGLVKAILSSEFLNSDQIRRVLKKEGQI